jgi:hypothetical protein
VSNQQHPLMAVASSPLADLITPFNSSTVEMTTNVLVLGAAGVVGFGICDAWLKEEDCVVYAVDRSQDALDGLAARLRQSNDDEAILSRRFIAIVGDFSTEESGKQAKAAILAKCESFQHVVSAIGCSSVAPAGLTAPDAIQRMNHTFQQVFAPNFIATNLFLDMIRNVPDSSFIVAGGPFTHHCPNPELYAVSMMGASFNHFGTILKFETINSKCRANTLCCHYAIGFPEDTESHFGPLLDTSFGPISDSRQWGKAFVRVAKGSERLGFICMHDPQETSVLVDSSEWIWFADQNKYGPKSLGDGPMSKKAKA